MRTMPTRRARSAPAAASNRCEQRQRLSGRACLAAEAVRRTPDAFPRYVYVPCATRERQATWPTRAGGSFVISIEFLVTSLIVVLVPGTGVIYTVSTGLV